MTGTMISSIKTVDVMIRSRCWMATSPEGFITTRLQPLSSSRAGIARRADRIFLIVRTFFELVQFGLCRE